MEPWISPNQSAILIQRLSESVAIMDERGHATEGHITHDLFNDDWKQLRMNLVVSLELIKRIECQD